MDAATPGSAPKRIGRRPGSADTRSEILAAARAEFATRGYEKATMRGIARAADVDSALVHHYFGSKDRVFMAAMEFPIDPDTILRQLAGDPAAVGERLARTVVTLWETPPVRDRLVALLRSVPSNEELAALLREFARHRLVARMAARLAAPDAELRVELALAQVIGLAMARYVIGIEPLASASPEDLVRYLAPVLQTHLVPQL
jgi:AcrR family transcriptional regulator